MSLFNRQREVELPPEKESTLARATALRAVTQAEKFEQLGSIGRRLFATHEGREYQIDGGVGVTDASMLALHDDDRIYALRVTEDVEGEQFATTRYKRAELVPDGTYARLAAEREAARTADANRDRPRPVDVHRVYGIVRGQAEVAIAGPRGLRATKLLTAPPDVFGVQPSGAIYSPPTPAPVAPAEVVAFYAARGVTLTAVAGHLLIEAKRGRLSQLIYDDLRADQRRLVAYLERRWPLPCELHPDRTRHDATRTYAIDVLGCEEGVTP